jgi:hypothetical protein
VVLFWTLQFSDSGVRSTLKGGLRPSPHANSSVIGTVVVYTHLKTRAPSPKIWKKNDFGNSANGIIGNTGPGWRLGSGVWVSVRWEWGVWGSGPRGAPPIGWYHQQVNLYNICSLGTLRTWFMDETRRTIHKPDDRSDVFRKETQSVRHGPWTSGSKTKKRSLQYPASAGT